MSLLTLTAISVDRLLALLLGLRYRQVVTLKRTNAIIIVFWVVSIVGSTLSFWSKLSSSLYIYIGTTVCLITSIYSYTKIFLTLRHHQNQIQVNAQGQLSQEIPLRIARYRRTVSSTLWVQLSMVFCYLPYNVMASLRNQSELSSAVYLGLEFSSTLIFLNSSLNPILYCWKIREVRQAAKAIIRQILCSCN